jgi:heptosyltransferase-1
MDILFIKTSSLGDVIHHMPAVTDARNQFPDARIAWIVEEDFAAVARLHPGVSEAIPVATRRWRWALLKPPVWREAMRFRWAVRARKYEAIIDTQGLIRTGLIAGNARGRRHGYDRMSIKEPLASWLYDVRHAVPRDLHAIERNRRLTALALGYALHGAIDYGLDRARLKLTETHPYAVLVHASAQPQKLWSEDGWVEVGRALAARDLDTVLPWGTPAEEAAANRIARRVPGARVARRGPLDSLARLIAGASLVVGVDTGLLHLAAALRVPLVAIFVASEPGLTGPMGQGPIAIVGAKGKPPTPVEVVAAIRRTV